jgi:nitrile hydratase subunit beta
MNGAHDMGGSMGHGPVRPEHHEPVFHAQWERRVLALTLAMGATGQWNIDSSRSAREDVPPAQYLRNSYYQIWFDGLKRLMLERGLITPDELTAGQAMQPTRPLARVLRAADVAAALSRGSPTARPAPSAARFVAGQRVLTRQINPPGHTRLPRYIRGKTGVVITVHGAHVFADSHASGAGEQPQWLYTVEFDGKELWGPDTSADSVCVDCWEAYLS